jgi:hypothetical protein
MQMKRMDTWLMMSWYSHRPEAILQFIHDRQRKIQDMTNIQIVTQAKTFGSCCFVPPIFQSRISITIFHWKWLDQTPEKKTNDSCSCVSWEKEAFHPASACLHVDDLLTSGFPLLFQCFYFIFFRWISTSFHCTYFPADLL